MFVIPVGPLLAWKRGDLLGVAQRLMTAFAIGIAALAIVFAIKGGHSILAPFGVGLALFVMLGALTDCSRTHWSFSIAIRNRLSACRRTATRRPGALRSLTSALVCPCSGIVCAATWGTESIVAVKPTQTVSLSGYEFSFDGLVQRPGPSYNALVARFTVRSAGVPVGIMEPSKRSFSARGMTTNEAALMSRGLGQLYLSLGDSSDVARLRSGFSPSQWCY